MTLTHVRIVGAGLIGTSIGLALRSKGVNVTMADINPEAARLAQDLMGQNPNSSDFQLTVVAAPLSTVSQVIKAEIQQGFNLGFIDISSVKVNPVVDTIPPLVEVTLRNCILPIPLPSLVA